MSAVRVGRRTAWVVSDGVAYVAALPGGRPLVLSGPAADIWQALVPGGTVADIADRVAASYEVSLEVVSEDVASFVADLVGRGVLEPA